MKVDTIVFDGIDRSGKDTLARYLTEMTRDYILTVRGIQSNLAYAQLFNREEPGYDLSQHKHELFVFVTVNKSDWEIRCKITKEPKIEYEKHYDAFLDAFYRLQEAGCHCMIVNTSVKSIQQCCLEILSEANRINKGE